jgi:hypothetical protein
MPSPGINVAGTDVVFVVVMGDKSSVTVSFASRARGGIAIKHRKFDAPFQSGEIGMARETENMIFLYIVMELRIDVTGLEVVIKTVCSRDAAVELTGRYTRRVLQITSRSI